MHPNYIYVFLNSKLVTVDYDVIRMDRSRRGSGAACYIKKSSYSHKSIFCPNIENIFI